MNTCLTADAEAAYELRFCSLFDEGRGLSFPCDAFGQVQLDGLGPKARHNYLYARAVIGLEYAMPVVHPRYPA